MKEIRIYQMASGAEPFSDWLHELKDAVTRSRIRRRIDRLSLGNEGDFRSVGDGVFELRLPFGPGYRVYYGNKDQQIVILLCGGDKRTQVKDIKLAKQYWKEFKRSDKDE